MTLTEYLNQETPIRKPVVYLERHQYSLGFQPKVISPTTKTQVFIIDEEFVKMFGPIEYCLIGKGGILHTTDSDGNPKRLSTFRI